ncbi:MAG: endolytic transglycosylase MltG [Anaerolineales bacterium]|jgi:UPF0755 protein
MSKPKRGRTCLTLFILSNVILLLCAGAWIGTILMLEDAERSQVLPNSNPDLDMLQRLIRGGYLLIHRSELNSPAGDPAASLQLEVLPGQTAGSVVDSLQGAGVVHNGLLLENYLLYSGLDIGVEAGLYQLHGSMTIPEIAQALQSASRAEIVFVVPEGWRLEQIADSLPMSDPTFNEADFLAATQTRPPGYSFSGELPEPPSLEGFLFPDTYHADPDLSAEELVLLMLDNFENQVGADLRSGFAQQGLSLYQAVTLASIVEREAVVADERPLIASVFLNRLAIGMKLDADPTVQYALGRQPDGSWWKAPLTLADLQVVSRYNTYLQTGLPWGPIANPGLSSLQAVAFPSETPYLYFRARCDGSGRHLFAETYEEHLQNECP